MRASEWIQGSIAAILALASLLFPLSRRRRSAICLLALCALVCIAIARASALILTPRQSSILRDWLPVLITFVPYWQTGQFFVKPDEKLQTWLVASDRWFFTVFGRTGLKFGRAARLSMEWAYVLCYPIVPIGLAVLCVTGLRREVDIYWFLVLVPTYLCYLITPFFPALPPRSLGQSSAGANSTKSRAFNLWLLKHGSIQAISFPSAHVAAALGAALMLLRFVPPAGVLFLVVSVWIAVAAVAEGYHYTIDALLGAVLSLAVYFVWRAGWIPSTLFTASAIIFVAPL